MNHILFLEILNIEGCGEKEIDKNHLSQEIKFFLLKLKSKFTACNRSYKKLEEKEEKWLDEEIQVKLVRATSGPGPGRPSKNWDELGERSKRAKIATLYQNNAELLTKAAVQSAKQSPTKADMAFVLKKVLQKDIKETRKSLEVKGPTKMTTEEALELKVQTKMSDMSWHLVRNAYVAHNADTYPPLHRGET